MKRRFITHPETSVLASSSHDTERYSFWSTDVADIPDIWSQISKAIEYGTTFDDIDDYLDSLYAMRMINDEEFSELINWADVQLHS